MSAGKIPHPLFRLGFRPLFFFGALSGVLLIAWWTFYWTSLSSGTAVSWMPVGGSIWWHGHEMVFGFTTAIIGGFLLTAVRNWTGIPTITGAPLMMLVGVWLLARLTLAFGSGLPGWLVLLIDESYLVGLMVAVAYPIIKAKMWRNLMFVPILLLFVVLNALSYGSVLGVASLEGFALNAIHGAIFLVALIIAIIGGRVLPFFTANGLRVQKIDSIPALDAVALLSLLSLVAMAVYGLNDVPSALLASVAFVSGLANLIRLGRLQFWLCFKVPLLWSLHLFFSFIAWGLLALSLYALEVIDSLSPVLHLITVGAIGGMILSMITRVSLGHTGRPLQASKPLAVAFGLLFVSVVMRSVLPMIMPELISTAILIAGGLWVIAFGLFVCVHGPHLLTARPDGKPI
ncbi:NnrS family protein [Litoribrevibacter albus]|uniref:Short-chain dehydrogenase n=1 Tax=Litoribrevibacter albus TaxID=1473156 RepID=A0AA37SBN5_9GAMM|nr:NnrS family protein [Litoribrevibacter albus]GLQ31566.1 short-chain dehydrogenase [Litoribrevibacter albus]